MLVGYIESFYDATLKRRTRESFNELRIDLEKAERVIYCVRREEIDKAKKESETVQKQVLELLKDLQQNTDELFQHIIDDLYEDTQNTLEYFPIPEPKEEKGVDEKPFYDSSREYEDQIMAYDDFKKGLNIDEEEL